MTNDDEVDDVAVPSEQQIGTITFGEGSGEPIRTLWVPDPEQRHGWREFYVYPPQKPKRPIGFGAPQ